MDYSAYLNINNILWSKGCVNCHYKNLGTECIVNDRYMLILIEEFNKSTHNFFWIRNTSIPKPVNDLDLLIVNIDKIKKPFILITSDGDRPVPSSYNSNTVHRILNNNKVLSWFTQNYDRSIIHSKLKYMPIGLDLHTQAWFINNSNVQKIEYMIKKRISTTDKITNKIFADFHLHRTHAERNYLYDTVVNNESIFFTNSCSFQNITDLYNKYQFVLSPRGNGFDCHRTWELFLAGAIIITKTTPLDNMFIDNNLPVVILQDWNELNDNIEEKLTQWYAKYVPLTSIENIFPKMTFNYWLTK